MQWGLEKKRVKSCSRKMEEQTDQENTPRALSSIKGPLEFNDQEFQVIPEIIVLYFFPRDIQLCGCRWGTNRTECKARCIFMNIKFVKS
jgi:hypothetical protein